LAGIAIGLTLAAIHLVGINISGSSVNPARSLGPAIVGVAHNPEALKQIWLYILAPLFGAGQLATSLSQGCLQPKRSSQFGAKAYRIFRLPHRHLAKRSRGGD
jgi:aquaporin Z